MPRLIVLQPSGTAKQINLVTLPFVVGRASGSDLVVDHPQVSRTHAIFDGTTDAIRIRDMGSNNGTCVNGQRIGVCALANGDEIKIGTTLIRFLASSGEVTEDEALRLVTVPGKLTELDLHKLTPTARK